jgi:CHAT domain
MGGFMPQMQREPERRPTYQIQQQSSQYQPTAKELRQQEKQQRAREREQRAREHEEAIKRAQVEREAELKRIEKSYSDISNKWIEFQKVKHDLPPSLLPLEAVAELDAFHAYIKTQYPYPNAEAYERFDLRIKGEAKVANQALMNLETALRPTSIGSRVASYFDFGIDQALLKKCAVSLSAPKLGSPEDETIISARKFLRTQWSNQLEPNKQSIVSIHKSAGKTVIQIGSRAFGSVFITVPRSLDPEELATSFISRIRRGAGPFFKADGTVAVLDGAYQNINHNKIFKESSIVRSISADFEAIAKNLPIIIEREGPTANNSSLHLGVPRTEQELKERVFKDRGEGADWDIWEGVAETWDNHAVRHGFDRSPSASAQQILESLSNSKNVIIVIAHGDSQKIVMPEPPPEGSELSTDQLLERKAEIALNRPLVYLFCCETAEITDLKSFAQVLLECGVSGVIAPQTKIDAEKSINFFDRLVSVEKSTSRALQKIRVAQKSSGYREMEVWLG